MQAPEVVLVTGGAGFIGSHVVEKLLSLGRQVICLDNFDSFYPRKIKEKNLAGCMSHKNFHFREGDIRDIACLDELFTRHRVGVIFHAAARAGVRPSILEPLLYEEVNIRGTLNLLETAHKFSVPHFVFASSSSVYGENEKIPFSESDNVDHPISPYAATKKAGELLCYTAHHLYGISMICLRFFTVYGPRQRPEMAIHKFTRLIDKGKPVPVYGDGTSRRDYTYIEDIVDGVIAAIDRRFSYEVVNLGESETVGLLELISLIEENLGKKAVLEWHSKQAGDVPITYAGIEKAERLLDYNPGTHVHEGIREFVKWYEENHAAMEGL